MKPGMLLFEPINTFWAEPPKIQTQVCYRLGDIFGKISGDSTFCHGRLAFRVTAGFADGLDVQLFAEAQHDVVSYR
jgi:hypothetical protein